MGLLKEKLDPAQASEIALIVDIEVIDGLIEDTSAEFFPSLLEVFETESEERLANIQLALTEQDAEMLGMEAHSLKGTSATFGAEELRTVAFELEQVGKAGDMDRAAVLVPKIAPLYDKVAEVLRTINRQLQS